MKSAMIRSCLLVVLMLVAYPANAADSIDFDDVSGTTLSQEGPYDVLVNGDSTMVFSATSGAPTKILHIAANLDNGTRNMWVTMDPITEYTNPAYYRILILNPATDNLSAVTPGAWQSFNPAQSKTFFTGNTPAHGGALILACDTQSCTFY